LRRRKEASISGSGSSFVKVLRSYQTGGITYGDFLEQVNRYLAAGESPSELLDVLRRRQRIEPLPDFAHDAVARLLNEPSLSVPEEFDAPEEPAVTPAVAPPAPLAAHARVTHFEPIEPITPGTLELPLDAPSPAATPGALPLAAIEKTVVIPRGGLTEDGPDAATDIDTDPLFSGLGPIDARAAAPRRASWPRRGLWLCAAILVLFIAWMYGRPSATTSAVGAASSQPNRAVTPARPTAAAAPPGSTFRDCPACPRMTVLPTGRFKQGAARDDHDALPAEKPQHIVLIREPIAISTSGITVGEFREFVAATRRELAGCDVYDGEWHHKTDSSWLYPGFTQNSDHPVTCVSWNDAVAYAEWLSAKTGHHYRLPSASEWEYAARAGVDAALPWSPAMQAACEHANVADRSAARRYPKWSVFACKDGYVNTAPVASFKANGFGIYDMLGNVLGWTQDCWHDDYAKAPVDGSARLDGDCVEHELRGGSWFSSPAFVRFSYRNHSASGYRSSSVGIRLVRELAP